MFRRLLKQFAAVLIGNLLYRSEGPALSEHSESNGTPIPATIRLLHCHVTNVPPPPQAIRRRSHRQPALLLRSHAASSRCGAPHSLPSRLGIARRPLGLPRHLRFDPTRIPPQTLASSQSSH